MWKRGGHTEKRVFYYIVFVVNEIGRFLFAPNIRGIHNPYEKNWAEKQRYDECNSIVGAPEKLFCFHVLSG